jgi:hypothetical protein
LSEERAQATEVVERRKAERTRAQAYADSIREKALASKAVQRPVELTDAERLLSETTIPLTVAAHFSSAYGLQAQMRSARLSMAA